MSTQPIYTQDDEKKPLVSFIITYYNESVDMLKECVNSILSLSLNAAERQIIVVDDGSDVSPIDLLIELSSDIIYVRQPNLGLSRARNRGIGIAEGSFIQFVDADDYLLTNTYEQCLDIIRYRETDMVLFQSTSSTTSTPHSEADGPMSGTDYMAHHNLRGSACGYVFRKAILHNLRHRLSVLCVIESLRTR